MPQHHIVIKGERASGKTTVAWGIQSWMREVNKQVQVIRNQKDYDLAYKSEDMIFIWDDCIPPEGILVNRIITVEHVR